MPNPSDLPDQGDEVVDSASLESSSQTVVDASFALTNRNFPDVPVRPPMPERPAPEENAADTASSLRPEERDSLLERLRERRKSLTEEEIERLLGGDGET